MNHYTVQPGDTLSLLAKKYLGPTAQASDFQQWNEIPDLDFIYVGQPLVFPDQNDLGDTHLIGDHGVPPEEVLGIFAFPTSYFYYGAAALVVAASLIFSPKKKR